MAVAVLDANCVITVVNDQYVARVMSREASIGSSFADIFEEANRQAVSDALTRAAHGGMEQLDGVRMFCCGPGPNDFPQNTIFSWTFIKHNDGFLAAGAPDARITGASSSETEELKNLINKAPIALHWLSSTGKVFWANDRVLEVLGYSREEYIGADMGKFGPESRNDVLLELFKHLGSKNTVRDVPVRFRAKIGKVQDLLIDSNASYASDGSFSHMWCVIRDDTGRKLREARAEAVAAAAKELAEGKARFSAKLLHNIRTPLHIMTMSLSDPAASVDLPALESQVRRLSGLCTSVARAMKFDEAHVVVPLPIPTNLSSLLREYEKAKDVRHKVAVEELGFDESLAVLADGGMIKTVLDELIAHADGRSPPGASIWLSVERKEVDHFEFRVADSGEKLEESRVEKVFRNYWLGVEDTFGRGEEGSCNASSASKEDVEMKNRLSAKDEALGLRLNVAFNYVQCLDSTLRVFSDTSTTTFKFSLTLQTSVLQDDEAHRTLKKVSPFLSVFHSVGAHYLRKKLLSGFSILSSLGIYSKRQPGAGVYSGQSKRVLIVEDNTICQKMCKRLVTSLGHKADTADNGAIAVEMATRLSTNVYDLVLMDLRMPVMDGITAAIKIHEVFPELPIVAFSAEEGRDTQQKALGDMVAFLSKPASAKDVERTIREYASCPSS